MGSLKAKVNQNSEDRHLRFLLVFSIFLFFLKLALLPLVQNTDSDAVSRIYISQSWARYPHLITHSTWGPFHFYLNGILFMVWNDPIIAPSVLNILFSVFTIIPFYFFTKRLYNPSGALIAAFFLGISPILFRNSFLCLSETPYLFFLAISLNCMSKAIRQCATAHALWAGLAMTLAAGFRYEAWLLVFLFSSVILFTSSFRNMVVFGLTAAIFPVYWLISNKFYTGDPFFSINGNYLWTIELMGNNENLDWESYLRRIWYFPFSLMIALGPITAWLVISAMRSTFRTDPVKSLRFLLAFLAICFLIIMIYNAFRGTLLLQHRFIGTMVLLSLPFVAFHFDNQVSKGMSKALWIGLSTVLLSFVYNTSAVKPVPRLKQKWLNEVVSAIQPRLDQGASLVVDFISWEGTYYCALMSRLPQERVFLVGGAKYSELPIETIREQLKNRPSCVLVLSIGSPLYSTIYPEIKKQAESGEIELNTIYDKNNVICVEYKP